MKIRDLHESDLAQLLVIEEQSHISPWNAETFERCWRAGYKGWVIEKENKVIGFIIATMQMGESHVLNLCVQPDCQHQGFGKKLMIYFLELARENKIGIVFLEVRRSNQPAILLYQNLGFIQIAERKNYYPCESGREDALVLAKDLSVID